MSRPVLDIVALRSLTAVADCGGFHRAAQALSLSQSAVSQHVRKLEKTLGRPVVEREGRGTRFTTEGRLLLEQARRVLAVHDEAVRTLLGSDGDTVTVGSTEHAADQFLPRLTAAVQAVRPGCRVRFRIDRSARLVEAVERGSVDVAVYVTEAAATEGVSVGGLPLTWHAVPGWERPTAPSPVPLVAIEDPCAIRRRAIATLAAHGVSASVVGDAGYLAGVLDIARTGQGVALLAAVGPAPDGLTPYNGLPPVPPIPMSALARPGADPATAEAAFSAVRDLLRP
ncbi:MULTISPECIES: LysR family transcriptional regulator [unclassified Streptomyces]|uniref:LysR family transcriptional regulator n=1 Tax=unclassified Streptomyces TaxID=2593676 RepID=UPI00225521E1|nr:MULTISPECIES: LysR family transcriptional regulator [unclassified Streptomyces]MCX5337205.1 LysR family transcriptional regulator [Streptomyces sp. NBC_00140]MCX5365844.1 LysR family transcriptional regulator [Streptomyces sp. NBC_00124]